MPAGMPEDEEELYLERQPLLSHLAATAGQFWVAEKKGKPIGFARSILRDSVLQLTEFFVAPGHQSAGVGRELFQRAFPADHPGPKLILATLDERALGHYLKSGLKPYSMLKPVTKEPQVGAVETDLVFQEPLTSELFEGLLELDQAVVGHRRQPELEFLRGERSAFVALRQGRVVGYGFFGPSSGPFAVEDPADWPAVLSHAESLAAGSSSEFYLELLLSNSAAVRHLLTTGYQLESFNAVLLSDRPLVDLDRYLPTSPPIIL
jgi:hypothetical protein